MQQSTPGTVQCSTAQYGTAIYTIVQYSNLNLFHIRISIAGRYLDRLEEGVLEHRKDLRDSLPVRDRGHAFAELFCFGRCCCWGKKQQETAKKAVERDEIEEGTFRLFLKTVTQLKNRSSECNTKHEQKNNQSKETRRRRTFGLLLRTVVPQPKNRFPKRHTKREQKNIQSIETRRKTG